MARKLEGTVKEVLGTCQVRKQWSLFQFVVVENTEMKLEFAKSNIRT